MIIGAHDTGPLIRSASGFWLAIPLPAAGKALGGKRITPAMWEQKTGLRLRFVYRSRGPSLLVADAVRLNSRGQAAVSKSKTGRGQGSSGSNRSGGSIAAKNAPIFLLVRQVKLPKRLDLARDASGRWRPFPAASCAIGWKPGELQGRAAAAWASRPRRRRLGSSVSPKPSSATGALPGNSTISFSEPPIART